MKGKKVMLNLLLNKVKSKKIITPDMFIDKDIFKLLVLKCHFNSDVIGRLSLLLLLLLLLSRFSRVRLCATPEMAAHQAPPSLGFSRQQHWSGLPFPSPMRESEVAQSSPTPNDPMDCSLPASSIHGFSRQEYWSGVPLLGTLN